MTEEESKKALFKIHLEYMSHTPNERIKLYDEYIAEREKIKKELAKLKAEKTTEEFKKYNK